MSVSFWVLLGRLDQSAGLTRSVAKTDRPMEAWYHRSIA
jgi:hypothetical protein